MINMSICLLSLFPSALGLPPWAEWMITIGFAGFLLMSFWIWISRMLHEKRELQRLLIEKSELIAYAADREQRAVEKAAEIDKTKKHLLSIINHEIRTPMSGIMGMVSLLADTSLTNEQKEYNETIKNCGESLLTVINDILLGDVLAHSKIESGAAELEQKDFDLRSSIEEVYDVFASHAAQKDIELIYQIDHRIPDQVIGDNTRLRQVLMNLVENAIKFTKRGEIFIKVEVRNEEARSMDLSFEVSDSGDGISADDLKFLSNTIAQPDAHRTGIGLFLCNRLVGIMGGTLSIDSRLKEGTTVLFNIKVNTGSLIQRTHLDMTSVKGKKVLIVEDNPTLRNVLMEELQYYKLLPVVAESGTHALEILAETRNIDLVLAEMQMPEMNGMKFSRVVRELYPSLPIVLMSTMHNEESKQHDGILTSLINKPIRYDELIQHVFSGLIPKVEVQVEEKVTAKAKMSTDFSAKYPLRILIAEDDMVNQRLAIKVLTKLGYQPDKVKNGKEVLEEVSKMDYDLILMDVQMPEMDGLEATRMIRLCLSSQPVIIAMTANTMQGDREECFRAGMDDYISKPVNLESLVIMLEKWALQVKARNNAI
jgi:signal transduction histidine kinase/DNA-binding response OmpR family regulator